MKLLKINFYTFATKMAAASTKNTRDSPGKHLGVKTLGGHPVYPNDILIRQRGFKWKPGLNTFYTRDHTILSKIEGIVKFTKEFIKKGKVISKKTYIHVIPETHSKKLGPNAVPYCYHPELYPELALHNPEFSNWEVKIFDEEMIKKIKKNKNEKPHEKLLFVQYPKNYDENGELVKRIDFPKISSFQPKSIVLPERYRANQTNALEDNLEEDQKDIFEEYEKECHERVARITNRLALIENKN